MRDALYRGAIAALSEVEGIPELATAAQAVADQFSLPMSRVLIDACDYCAVAGRVFGASRRCQ